MAKTTPPKGISIEDPDTKSSVSLDAVYLSFSVSLNVNLQNTIGKKVQPQVPISDSINIQIPLPDQKDLEEAIAKYPFLELAFKEVFDKIALPYK